MYARSWKGILVAALLLAGSARADAGMARMCDITGNGTVSQIDAMRVLEFVAGLRDLTPEQQMLADASGNGRVTAYDVTCIMKAATGIPVAGSHCDQMVQMP